MFIKSVVLDGFKSYGKRTEINGFDPEFTAITGLNGTGKSNVLDAICFVLGISNLGQVRATSLQELVFKSGQAGVTKATVTILFDNSDADQCPIGYEKCREISVTRQVVVGGKNKYLINGKTVLNKKVSDLFCSVQLNINNPNFLIMQGRITKVLNMKPHEILSMVEEAAGTSMYESKRDQTNKLIEKKDAKLNEMESVLKEEIEPKLQKLRQERAQYEEFQKIVREIESLTRIYISHKYLQQKEAVRNCENELQNITNFIETSKQAILDNEQESSTIDEECAEIRRKIDTESGGELKALEEELQAKSKQDAKVQGEKNSVASNLDAENRKLKRTEKTIKDDENALKAKETGMANLQSLFEKLKTDDQVDSNAYEESRKKYEAISSGLATNESGEASSLQDQLIVAKQQISEAKTTIKTSEMDLKHSTALLRKKQSERQNTDANYVKDKKNAESREAEIKRLEADLSGINYEEGSLEELQQQQENLQRKRRELRTKLEQKKAYRFEFQYQDPYPNFNRNAVKGRVCNLFEVKNPNDYVALSMLAGGTLYSVVTDTDTTSKDILKRGQLQQHTTLLPINKIRGSELHPSVVKCAQDLVGKENVAAALSLIKYAPEYDIVMKYVFGRTLVCKDINVAKKVTYHRNIMTQSVTLDGDVVDPQGTLSGGSRPQGNALLLEVAEIKEIRRSLDQIENELQSVQQQINRLQKTAQLYSQTKEQLDLCHHELKLVKGRLAKSSFEQHQQEIDELAAKVESLQKIIVQSKEVDKTASLKVKDIEEKLSDAKGYRERELKAATDEMKRLKKKSEESKKKWKTREQEYETMSMEIEELKKGIATATEQKQKTIEDIEALKEKLQNIESTTSESSAIIATLKDKVAKQKNIINSQNKELKSKLIRKDKLGKKNSELQVEIKRKENDITKLKNDNKDGFSKIANLEKNYPWIVGDKEYFGVKNTRYDYTKEDPEEAAKKLHKAQKDKDNMERHINVKAMALLQKEEQLYEDLQKRKNIVIEDKNKILKIIVDMDKKKEIEVKNAWIKVNANFGSIFSTLLPGAEAKLVPAEGNNSLSGLTVRVGFNGLWKDSLGELSGGQRSLVALSLILAMLKFKPAPLYILDEVDAALDMAHTQNIGAMLKGHFTNSQFVIVSLKDGMFNNANVLFKTKFEDGVSAVTRTENSRKTHNRR
ncbi:Structural maintenance of chromosomes protein 2 [Pseudolycoriella hygida]|uniref:Structural maintenance of chromosomes protein n=1 Tax=Pseudolycoriella hygida TaxID=35572 RepID=A0A9Q0NAA5_9DIPT|nr:Structural maintenance of chromosomes protein 2 [Pseudolycoriella hygida]